MAMHTTGNFFRDDEIDISCRFFFELKLKGQKEVLKWLMNVGLIASYNKCKICGENMKLCEQKASTDGYEWRCLKLLGINGHDIRRSVRYGSCFSYFGINMTTVLSVIVYWFFKCDVENIRYEFRIDDQKAADLYTFCREMCIIGLINNSVKVGGKDENVELDICKLGEMKYGRNKLPAGHYVLAGIEKRTKRGFFRIVDSKAKDDILDAIREWVLPGTVLISECWKSYDCDLDGDFIQLSTSNNLTFKSPAMSERDKSIAAAWSSFEGPLRNSLDTEVVLDSHLAEYIWRRQYNNSKSDNVLKTYFWTIIKCYKLFDKDI